MVYTLLKHIILISENWHIVLISQYAWIFNLWGLLQDFYRSDT